MMLGKKKVPGKRAPIMRIAQLSDDITKTCFVVPMEDAERLLTQAIKEEYGHLDVDYKDSVTMSINVLRKVNEILARDSK